MFYDTEAAATVAAARVSAKWQTAMVPYACGTWGPPTAEALTRAVGGWSNPT